MRYARRPELILLDLQVPHVGGLALLKQIHQADRRLPIIVITATQDTRMAAEALGNDAVAYLPKPFDPRHVEMLVATQAGAHEAAGHASLSERSRHARSARITQPTSVMSAHQRPRDDQDGIPA